MSSLIETVRALDVSRQIALAAALVVVVLSMGALAMGAMEQPKVVLYSGLNTENAGEVVGVLEQRGVAYELAGDAILVSPSDRDSIRFALAREGLPRQSIKGYELLEDVNGFSVTSEMYNAAYWRAKEGELTRTILAIPGVSAARVHVGASLRSGFLRSQPQPTASVTISTAYSLNASQIEGIQYLVALAIPGLRPGDVAVIDAEAGVVAGPGLSAAEKPSVQAASEAERLEQKILRLLDARVGAGNARVSVTLDVTRNRERTSTVTFDPQSRVVRSRTTTDSNQTAEGGGAAITVASNLPQGGVAAPGGTGTVETSTENVVYEVSETRTERETLPGEINRLSVAVLLNSDAVVQLPGAAVDDAALLASIEALVRSAAGISAERGDSITVDFMPFQAVPSEDLIESPGVMQGLIDRYFWNALQTFVLALVVIALALGVVRPLVLQRRAEPPALVSPDASDGLLISTEAGGQSEPQAADAFTVLRGVAEQRQDETTAILEDWLNDSQPRAINE